MYISNSTAQKLDFWGANASTGTSGPQGALFRLPWRWFTCRASDQLDSNYS